MDTNTGRDRQGRWAEPTATTRVLVVDDNPAIVQTCPALLRLSGFEVESAQDGRDAVEAAQTFRPEVAVLDIGLPEMDGFEVARRLRAEHGPELLLVAVTGYGQEEYRQRSRAAGFDFHFTKPVDLRALSVLISRLRPRARTA
jgi:two-component system CheB/CheR fusion protein